MAAAARLFRQQGYALTSMDDISDEVGIAKPTLYYYFRSKEEILSLIHLEIHTHLEARQAARAREDLGSEESIFAIMLDILELTETHEDYQRVWVEFYREIPKEAREARAANTQSHIARIVEEIRRGQRAGVFRTDVDAEITARQINGMCVWAYAWLPEHGLRAREVALAFWTNLRAGIATNPHEVA